MPLREMNFDGLVGPTHNYAGLSFGNVASKSHAGQESHPRAAALQGLAKMKAVADLGFDQGFLPPLARPALDILRREGFEGDDSSVIAAAVDHNPILLAQVYSASCMWTANAATVSPSCDTEDGKVHFTPANLRSLFHRSIEPPGMARVLKTVFADQDRFVHHQPLSTDDPFGDEGAANHTRLATGQGAVHLFVFGIEQESRDAQAPSRFPARQTLEASRAVASQHGVQGAMFVQQNPDVIDQGVFHNDVISVGTGRVLLYHENAFLDGPAVIEELRQRLGDEFLPLKVPAEALPVEACVSSYLFNSQLLEQPGGSMVLVAPSECEADEHVRRVCDDWCRGDSPIEQVLWMDVRESMRNGGGPACLRLRVPLEDQERAQVHPAFVLTQDRFDQLEDWIQKWYPETIHPDDLGDPALAARSLETIHALGELLGIECT